MPKSSSPTPAVSGPERAKPGARAARAAIPEPPESPSSLRIRATHFATGVPIEIGCANGKIAEVSTTVSSHADLQAGWVAPAFFDLQINGCDGQNFSSERLTIDAVRHVVAVCHRHGIGALCPTLVTNSFQALAHGMATLRQARDLDAALARALPCFHLEGPFISPEDGPRGAHPLHHVRLPDWDEFRWLQEAAGGHIGLLTLAPEREGALDLIEKVVGTGVVVAIGHTAAKATVIRDAIRAGARLSTHLGNGSHALLPRHDNYIWEQLAADELWASIIPDGHHLPPALVKSIVRAKTPARTILTCDSSSLAGMPPGLYQEMDSTQEILPSGKIIVPGTGNLAGSWHFTDACVGNVLRFAGVSLGDAIAMATDRPRQLLNQPLNGIRVGDPADLVLFDWEPENDFRVTATVVNGQVHAAR